MDSLLMLGYGKSVLRKMDDFDLKDHENLLALGIEDPAMWVEVPPEQNLTAAPYLLWPDQELFWNYAKGKIQLADALKKLYPDRDFTPDSNWEVITLSDGMRSIVPKN